MPNTDTGSGTKWQENKGIWNEVFVESFVDEAIRVKPIGCNTIQISERMAVVLRTIRTP